MGLFGIGKKRKHKPPRRLGLVLGGGAMRGAAHLGALSVLEEAGIRPSVVVGTSVGAIVGAGVAAGVSAAEMWEAFRVLDWRDVAHPSWHSRMSMFASDPLGGLITRVTRVSTVEELELPFAAVACDLLTGERVVMDSGDLRLALSASSAVPGVFEPVRHDGRLLVDGGVVDNLPVDVAHDMGADRVIALSLMPALRGDFEPKDMREVVFMLLNIIEHNNEAARDLADIVITPDIAHVSMSDFRQTTQAYDAGVAAATRTLPAIREALGMVVET